MNSLLLDFQTALRFFRRRRAAFTVIVITMALAIGANTAVFSILKALLFANLAVPDSDRVMLVWTTRDLPGRGRVDFSDAYPNYRLLRETTHSFAALGTTLLTDVNWEQADDTRKLQGHRVTASFFDVMRVQPVLGRLFNAQEEGPKAAPVVVIGHALWQSAFGGSPNVLGQTLRLNGVPHTVIGVMPPHFTQPFAAELWLPFDLAENSWTAIIGARQLNTFARLADGITVTAANQELRTFATRALEAEPLNKDWGWRVQPMRENLLSGADNALLLVQAGASVLLILAICNLASLLLAWAAERQRETAVRLALGATGWRLAQQFLVQSLTLVAIGGGLGVLFAWGTLPALQQLNPNPGLSLFLNALHLDRDALIFALSLIVSTGLIAGLLPALQARTVAFVEALRSESRGASLSRDALRWQQMMVVLQAAVSVMILTGAGLTGVGFYKLSQVRMGFETEGRLVLHLQFPEPAYDTHEKRAQLVSTLQQNLAREPALEKFGIGSTIPVGDGQWGGAFHPQLPTGEFAADSMVFHYRRVSPGYLSAIGIPLVEGRSIEERDRNDTPAVAVVSQALARKYWPGQSAIGRKLKRATPANAPLVEIVGVVGDVRDAGAGVPTGEAIYVPFDQASLRRAWIVAKGRGSTSDTLAAARRALRATEPGMAAYDIAPLEKLAWQANALPRLQVTLLGVFAIIAIGITALGSYGVMSQLVANRQKEIAIRAALGATRGGVLRLILWQNARLALSGTVLGLGLAWLAANFIQARLTTFDASPLWPYLGVAAGVLLLTQIASLIPARRAANIDVQTALQ